jgi:hypothetical protein
VDTGPEFVWGGIQWETMLLTSESLKGPWRSEGVVLHNDEDYDSHQARDSTIDIIDGEWVCLYKAKDSSRCERPALATSTDGIVFRKHGPLTIDGSDRLAFLSGSLFPGSSGPQFMGTETQLVDSRNRHDNVVYADEHGIGHGGGVPYFAAYRVNRASLDLETVYRHRWIPLPGHEHGEHPILGYSSVLFDHVRNRFLMYVEAIDPRLSKAIGINETVERLLVYETPLPKAEASVG